MTHPLPRLCRNSESHPREWVDFSDPTSELERILLRIPPTPVGGIQNMGDRCCRPDLNNPPTPVGGIQNIGDRCCRPDLNNPPTPVGGIQTSDTAVVGRT